MEEILQSNQCTFEREILDEIIKECTELNPWLPIETAPKDRTVLLFYPENEWYETVFRIARYDINEIRKPTHYQELPGDPE